MFWFKMVWLYGVLTLLMTFVVDSRHIEGLRKDSKISTFLAVQVLIGMAFTWPLLCVYALGEWIWQKWKNRNQLSEEEQKEIIHQASLAKERYLADKEIERARKFGAKIMPLVKDGKSVARED